VKKLEKQNVKGAEQSSSTKQENKKALVIIVAEIMQHFIKENLEPKEMLMVLRECENEAMVALIMERLANIQDDNS